MDSNESDKLFRVTFEMLKNITSLDKFCAEKDREKSCDSQRVEGFLYFHHQSLFYLFLE